MLAVVGTPQGSTEAAGLVPNEGQGSEMFAGATVPPQGLVWLAGVPVLHGSVFCATGPELGRASIKSNKVVCCEWEPGLQQAFTSFFLELLLCLSGFLPEPSAT